ncbi:MAG: peptidylprolyl isomerase, partial [Candidatus Aenigmatarchaeota archaeon]
YTGRIKESGELFDTTDEQKAKEEGAHNPNVDYGPVTIIVGSGMVMDGLDEKILDMEPDDEKEVVIPPEKAFGERKGDLIKTYSEKKFEDEDMTPHPGMRVSIDNKMGRVLSVNSGRVRVDLNHPLAGKTLEYNVKVEDIIDDEEEGIRKVMDFYLGGEGEVEIEEGTVKVTTHHEIQEQIREDIEDNLKNYLDVEEVEFEVEEGEHDHEHDHGGHH